MPDSLLDALLNRVMGSRTQPVTPDPEFGSTALFERLVPRTGNRPKIVEEVVDNPMPLFSKGPLQPATSYMKVRHSGPANNVISELLESYPDAMTRVPQITLQRNLDRAAGDISGPGRTPRISSPELAMWFGHQLGDTTEESLRDVLLHEMAHRFGYDEDDAQKVHTASHSQHPRMGK